MDFAASSKFSADPVANLKVPHPSDESQFFMADIKSVRHRDVKPHYDGLQNRLTKLLQENAGRKTPEYVQTVENGTRALVHFCMSGAWDLQNAGAPWPNNQANRDTIMSGWPGIAEIIKGLAEDDKNFFSAPTLPKAAEA